MNTLLRAACLGLLTFTLEIHGQVAPPVAPPRALEKDPAFQGEAYRLMREIEARSQAYAHLEELCDGIGGRPTGSEALDRAQAWVKTKLRAFGITHVKEEPFTVPSGWVRGEAKARLLTANGLDLRVAQIGWTPATPGSLRAEVVIVGGKTVDALKESLAKARGKIALRGELPPPPAGADKAAFQRDLRALWDQAGLLAILFPMSRTGNTLQAIGTPVRPSSQWTPAVPSAYLGKEHANLLRRLLARGQQVSLALELGGRLLPEPFQSRNLIVEIPGSERPQECVIVGAHLDSVDLATGATDNGAGVAALLELLRAVHASGLRPVRTLRVIFFSGEELESLGSRAYVDAHRTELANIQAVLVMDKGAGRIIGWPTMGQEAWVPFLAEAMAPGYTVGCSQIQPGIIQQSDHEPFFEAGVPAFFAIQESLDYWTVYHSDLDSFDHVEKGNLDQACQALAATAWGFLQMPRRVPHRSIAGQ